MGILFEVMPIQMENQTMVNSPMLQLIAPSTSVMTCGNFNAMVDSRRHPRPSRSGGKHNRRGGPQLNGSEYQGQQELRGHGREKQAAQGEPMALQNVRLRDGRHQEQFEEAAFLSVNIKTADMRGEPELQPEGQGAGATAGKYEQDVSGHPAGPADTQVNGCRGGCRAIG